MNIDKIIKALSEKGKIVAIKTDTVYGLVCNAYDKVAVKKIYSVKKRDEKKPLSIFVKDTTQLKSIINDLEITSEVNALMTKYWPGPLTIVFKLKNDNLKHLTGGKSTIGIRMPNDKMLLNILEKIDFPLAQTSCNLSNEKEYNNAKEIIGKFGNSIDLIVDGGNIENNVPSTVICIENNKVRVIREGAIKFDT